MRRTVMGRYTGGGNEEGEERGAGMEAPDGGVTASRTGDQVSSGWSIDDFCSNSQVRSEAHGPSSHDGLENAQRAGICMAAAGCSGCIESQSIWDMFIAFDVLAAAG